MSKKYTDSFGNEYKLDRRIKLNGSEYMTDKKTVEIFASILPEAIASDDFSAAIAMLFVGEMAGRIVKCN